MKKLFLLSLLVFTFSAGMVTAKTTAINGLFEGNPIVKLLYNGKEVKPEGVPAYTYKSRTMVPIAFLRQLGVDVKWDAKDYSATIVMPPPRVVYALTQGQLDELSKFVYKVTTASTDGHPNGKQGSAFIVDGYMVTNNHVAGDAAYAQVNVDGNVQKATTYDFNNATVDVMGWKVQGGKSLPYSTELPQRGDPVYDISFPGGKLAVTEGQVTMVYELNKGITRIVHTAKTAGGGSGGILLNGRGQIIGINESGLDEISIAVPIQYVLDEINKLK